MSDKNSQNNSTQETVTENPKRIKELEKQLAEKDTVIEDIKNKTSAEINEIKQKTSDAIENIKLESLKNMEDLLKKVDISKGLGRNLDDIAPGIRKMQTFEAGYRNAYETAEYKKKFAKAKEEQEKRNKKRK